MASPLYDALVVQFSNYVGDPVAAATAAGKIWSVDQRDNIFNEAQRRLLLKWASANPPNYNALRGHITRGAQTLAASVKTLSSWTGGVFAILSAYNVTDNAYVSRLPDGYGSTADSGRNTYYTASSTNQFWKQEDATFRLLGGTATSSIRLEYIKEPVTLDTNGSSEVLLIPATYYAELVDLAVKVANEEKARKEWWEAALLKERLVEKEIAQSGNLAEK